MTSEEKSSEADNTRPKFYMVPSDKAELMVQGVNNVIQIISRVKNEKRQVELELDAEKERAKEMKERLDCFVKFISGMSVAKENMRRELEQLKIEKKRLELELAAEKEINKESLEKR